MACKEPIRYNYHKTDRDSVIAELGKPALIDSLKAMLLIRNFEIRAESAYLQGKVGGFFHSYVGQEAIQTAAVQAMGVDQWWVTSYRCHALALLLGATPDELMSELYGKANGNARGRGGSMHFFTERLLGGFGIVGGQIPIATGAAFASKYKEEGRVSICFFGDGASVQGAFHESLNIAALWDLPCIYVIENNKWGMGTAADRAVAAEPIAERQAASYGIKSYTLDGMDFVHCYAGFKEAFTEVKRTSRPVLIECVGERFRGHSISDPGLYRSKESLKECMQRDPIQLLFSLLSERGMLSAEEYEALDKRQKEIALAALEHAEKSALPDPITLEEDVFAP